MAMKMSPAGVALFGNTGIASGYGNAGGAGDMLKNQVGEETDEEKLRRKLGLSALQNGSALNNLTAGSPAMKALFGGLGGINLNR